MSSSKKNMRSILHFTLFFLFGALAASVFFYFGLNNLLPRPSFLTGQTINFPSDIVNTKDIIVYPDKVVVKVKGVVVDSYDSTDSMAPVLGGRANGISIIPQSEEEINVGDIITFRTGKDLYVHRVVEKGVDAEGTYFITKGDNNNFVDSKIRFRDIKYVLVGLIY